MAPNSYVYILFLLPLTAVIHWLLARFKSPSLSQSWILLASFAFVVYQTPRSAGVLALSILFNYLVGSAIQGRPSDDGKGRRTLFWIGVLGDLGLLLYFKSPLSPFLPLGISFFTFQQITYLDQSQRIPQRLPFLDSATATAFFPSLVSGPITPFSVINRQMRDPQWLEPNSDRIADGVLLFLLGLTKKILIADRLAIWADGGFSQAGHLSPLQAWLTALSFSFQLYFDFSGYSDMAVGGARLFNLELPWNFDSPFSSPNIREFWRRWHISLSEWIRIYAFEPLQMLFRDLGPGGTLLSVFLAFAAMGLWHGLRWTYLCYGAMHAIYITLSYSLQKPLKRFKKKRGIQGDLLPRSLHIVWTFLLVCLSFVMFRAERLGDACNIFAAMAGFGTKGTSWIEQLRELNLQRQAGISMPLFLLGLLGFSAWLSVTRSSTRDAPRLFSKPLLAGFAMALMLLIGLVGMNRTSHFLYFDF